MNDLRGRITVRTDGGLKTGRDVVMAAMLGAEEYGFGTAAVVAIGCDMARACHLNTCPTGVATQDPKYRGEVRRHRRDGGPLLHPPGDGGPRDPGLARVPQAGRGHRAAGPAPAAPAAGRRAGRPAGPDADPDAGRPERHPPAHARRQPQRAAVRHRPGPGDHPRRPGGAGERQAGLASTTRSRTPTGRSARGWRARSPGGTAAKGLPKGTIEMRFKGSAGQSFGAWATNGMRLILEGEANDYVGEGALRRRDRHHAAAGGRLRAARERHPRQHDPLRRHQRPAVRQRPGRRAVRGPQQRRDAVVEGAGDHCCEYMTGGTVVVLGEVGRNFAAGMSNGVAYVFDPDEQLPSRYNPEMVKLERVMDLDDLRGAVRADPGALRARPAARAPGTILDTWDSYRTLFWKVVPGAPPPPPPAPEEAEGVEQAGRAGPGRADVERCPHPRPLRGANIGCVDILSWRGEGAAAVLASASPSQERRSGGEGQPVGAVAMSETINVGLLGHGVVGGGVARTLRDKAETIARRVGRPVALRASWSATRPATRDADWLQITTDPAEVLDDPDDPHHRRDDGRRAAGPRLHPPRHRQRQARRHRQQGGDGEARAVDRGGSRREGAGRRLRGERRRRHPGDRAVQAGPAGERHQPGRRDHQRHDELHHHPDEHDRARLRHGAHARPRISGYAEPDPTNDVEGIDAAYKLAILSTLAFHARVHPDQVYREGITGLQPSDFRYARELGYAIRLLAIAKLADGGLEARVHPTLVPAGTMLASVDDVYNAVQVEGDLVGRILFYGRGAGAGPTASAVVADIIDLAQRISRRRDPPDRRRAGRLDHGPPDGRRPQPLLHAAGGRRPPGRHRPDRRHLRRPDGSA